MTNCHSRSGTAAAVPGPASGRKQRAPRHQQLNTNNQHQASVQQQQPQPLQVPQMAQLTRGKAPSFAASKWGHAPAPQALPRPPTHWTCAPCAPVHRASALHQLHFAQIEIRA